MGQKDITEKLLEKGQNAAYIGVTDRDEAVGANGRKGFEAALHKKKVPCCARANENRQFYHGIRI